MCFLVLILLILLNSEVNLINSLSADADGLCRYKFESKILAFPVEVLKVKTAYGMVFFTICKHVYKITSLHVGCKDNSSACILVKDKLVNGGTDFEIEEPTNNDLILKSVDGQQCSTNIKKNYTIRVNLVCSETANTEPELIDIDNDCTYNIRMMKPDCVPFCTIRKRNKLIDLRPIKNPLLVNHENRTFSISLCGDNPHCGIDVASCEITTNKTNIIPISATSDQQIDFDSNNKVIVKGSYKYSKGHRRRFEIFIKCHWNTVGYKNLQADGVYSKQYKFSLQSRSGCVTYEPNCTFTDLFNYKYDISKLNRRDNYWNVKNSPNKMNLNICGPLGLNSFNNICTDTNSQICEIINSSEYINHGSIHMSLKIENDLLQANIIDGSECKNITSLNYNTLITFVCSFEEHGPSFLNRTHCTTHLLWNTPQACPTYFVSGGNCYVSDQLGPRKLAGISQQNDTILNISNKSQIRYRLCNSLNNPCGLNNNVSFCLHNKDDGTTAAIGFSSNVLISENGNLKMILKGETCKSNKKNNRITAETTIYFVCSHDSTSSDIQVIEDNCKYNLTVHTPLACIKQTVENCKFCRNGDDDCIDLTPLSLENFNYVIRDRMNPDLQYILNICRSVNVDSDTICPLSMICMRNQSAPNIKDRYKSLGGITQPKLLKEAAIIETVGSVCGNENYKTVINLSCSENNEQPKLLKIDGCTHEFLWETKYACENLFCVYKNANTGSVLDLRTLNKKKFTWNLTHYKMDYFFEICSDNYNKCTSGNCKKLTATSKLFSNEYGAFIEYKLSNYKCNELNDPINRVLFHIICDEIKNNDHFEYDGNIDNCTLHLNLKTSLACSYKDAIITSIIKPILMNNKSTIRPQTNKKSEFLQLFVGNNNCTISNTNNIPYYVFNVSSYTYNNVSLAFDRYITNHNKFMLDCSDSIICRRSFKYKFLGYDCPNVVYDYEKSLIRLHYSGNVYCTESIKYSTEIVLKCNRNNETYSPIKFTSDTDCMISFESTVSEICKFFPPDNNSTTTIMAGVIGGIVIFVILIVSISVIWCWKKFKGPYRQIAKKDQVVVYCKDTTI